MDNAQEKIGRVFRALAGRGLSEHKWAQKLAKKDLQRKFKIQAARKRAPIYRKSRVGSALSTFLI